MTTATAPLEELFGLPGNTCPKCGERVDIFGWRAHLFIGRFLRVRTHSGMCRTDVEATLRGAGIEVVDRAIERPVLA